jgi:hypothetical protein
MKKTGKPADWTHCKRGHEFTEANTYRYPSNGRRSCRKCAVERHSRVSLTPSKQP